MRHFIVSLNMYLEYNIPILGGHLLEVSISENASIVNEYIDATKVVDSGLNNLVSVYYTVIIRCCDPCGSFDLGNYFISGLRLLHVISMCL